MVWSSEVEARYVPSALQTTLGSRHLDWLLRTEVVAYPDRYSSRLRNSVEVTQVLHKQNNTRAS